MEFYFSRHFESKELSEIFRRVVVVVHTHTHTQYHFRANDSNNEQKNKRKETVRETKEKKKLYLCNLRCIREPSAQNPLWQNE